MDEFKKQQLIESLNEIEQIHRLGLTSIALLSNDKCIGELNNSAMSYYNIHVFLKQFSKDFKNPEKRNPQLVSYFQALENYLLREPITILKEYCRINKINDLEKQDWFSFAIIIRNYVTHGILDYENRYKKTHFPIEWNGNQIREKDVKTSNINLKKFSHGFPMELFNKIRQFAQTLPDN